MPPSLHAGALQPLEQWPSEHRDAWCAWLRRYSARVAADGRPTEERRAEGTVTNPTYGLRDSMALEAYEAAAKGDYSVVRELHAVLLRPYEDQGEEVDERWAQKTPQWARKRLGVEFMS